MSNFSRVGWLNPVLLVLCLAALIGACLVGSTSMQIDRVLAALAGHGSTGDQLVVLHIRLPRALTALAVGCALGMSGAALQGLLRNPLAEPGVLGVSSCAALGATLTINFGLVESGAISLPFAAIAGALAATALLSTAALRIGSSVALILVGVGLSSFAAACIALAMNLSPNPFTLSDMINWMLGSVANRSYTDILRSLPFILTGMALLMLNRRGLSVLTLGEEAAAGAGLNLPRVRVLSVLGAGIATGAAVSLAGAIGFVGIVAPHLVRPLCRYDPSATLIPSALLGGLLLVVADIGIRIVPTNAELNLGVAVALLGAPAFVWIASRQGIHHGR